MNKVNVLIVGKDDTVVDVGRGDSQPVKMLHSFWEQLQVLRHPRPKWGYEHSTKIYIYIKDIQYIVMYKGLNCFIYQFKNLIVIEKN